MRPSWAEANQIYLAAVLAGVREALERHAQRDTEGERRLALAPLSPLAPVDLFPDPEAWPFPDAPPALEIVTDLFDLSPFARALLALTAGIELDARFAPLCAQAQGDRERAYPTFGLALAALPGAAWAELSPEAPLRRWRLLEIPSGGTGSNGGLAASRLEIDERILHFLAGVDHRDQRLEHLTDPVHPSGPLVPSHRLLAARITTIWTDAAARGGLPAIQLCGPDPASRRAVAAAVCDQLELELVAMGAEALPTAPRELDDLLRLWQREMMLGSGALLIDAGEVDAGSDPAREAALGRFVERLDGPLFLASRERRRGRERPLIAIDVARPTTEEQRDLWRDRLSVLAEGGLDLSSTIEGLAEQFDLPAPRLEAAAATALGALGAEEEAPSPAATAAALWDACRQQARPRLDDLAQRIEPTATWDDLILPPRERELLKTIAAHIGQRTTVHERWGMGGGGWRGRGVSALFSGPSGTGKTLAAEVLAGALRLDLYRIDLAITVSKYIGETEKNLRRVFDAAEEGGAILLFDEADALFGKRSEVKDSHDRHANIEVSYLLQRMESYRGLAILTSNLKDALDPAFLRRLRFMLQFPFPDADQRAGIWRRAFSSATPTEGIDEEKLSRLNVSGGNIRNIALSAAFLAAAERGPVRMAHLLEAARIELIKVGRPLTDAETRDWI
jgi:hypothetical protein